MFEHNGLSLTFGPNPSQNAKMPAPAFAGAEYDGYLPCTNRRSRKDTTSGIICGR